MPLNLDYHPHQGNVTHHKSYLTYIPPSPLSHWVQSFWQLNVPEGSFYYRSVPDNCVDLIININHVEDAVIITPFSSPNIFKLSGPVSYFGIRFRILGHLGLTSIPLGEWDTSEGYTKTTNVISNQVVHAISECINAPFQFNIHCQNVSIILLNAVTRPKIDSRLVKYIRYCHQNISSQINLSDKQCSEFGVSSRQLRRLTRLHLGLSPREFSRVIRFQHALRTMSMPNSNTSWADNYYDQPHFIREFRSLSGLTPYEFKNLSVLYNSDDN